MSETIRGYRKLAEEFNRDYRTVVGWVERGCPHWTEGRANMFDRGEVEKWCESQIGIDLNDDDSDDEGGDQYKLARTRKTILEADKLEHEKQVREGLFLSVDQVQPTWESALHEIKDLVESLVDEIKEMSPGLTAEESEGIDKKLADGFNTIADSI